MSKYFSRPKQSKQWTLPQSRHHRTGPRNFESYEDRFDEPENYFDDALERIADSYAELTDAVDCALAYFEGHGHRLVKIVPRTLTLAEKIHRLSTMTNTRSGNYKYKNRFAMHLHACLWVTLSASALCRGIM